MQYICENIYIYTYICLLLSFENIFAPVSVASSVQVIFQFYFHDILQDSLKIKLSLN